MGATTTEGAGSGAVENSFPRIQNNIKPQNLAGNVLGDITFDHSKIVGENGEIGFNTTPQGATIISPNGEITLVPNNTSSVIANGQYLRIYPTAAYDAPHIHITSGDGGDLLIGNDDRNLDVNNDDNIYIKTNQETTGYQWKFGKDATMNLPDLADSPSSQGDTGSLTRNGDVLYFKASGGWVPISTGLPSLGNFNPTAIVSYTDSVVPLSVHQISASDNGKLFILDKSENGFITLPVLSTTTIGQTFWIDPPGYDLCVPYYIKSTKNIDMNDPGIRYYHLWDLNPDDNGNLNRIGKVFPDQEIVIIDDEEVIASMSYKSNRNWTLPSPKLTLLTPNTCTFDNATATGVMTNPEQRMWVTYRFDTNSGATSSLHCNYYTVIKPENTVTANTQNVAVRFGPEFNFLNAATGTTSNELTGFTATSMKLLVQIVTGDTRPSSTAWREIDVTTGMTLSNGYITQSSITGTTFQINVDNYYPSTGATLYELNNYISIPQNGQTNQLNFGDEYYFYGNLETDISATIYEMKYLINLGRNQFTNTSNPTWTKGTKSYVTEIGLYDSNKDLIVISKLQSPELRQGIQQYVVKLDF